MPTIVIAVVVAIPMMVVLEAAVGAVPVAAVEATAFMARADPMRAGIRRTSPVTAMPDVIAVGGVPISLNPNELRTRTDRDNIMSGRRRRANLNSDRDLGSQIGRAHV